MRKVYSYFVPGIERIGVPIVIAHTKGEARSIVKTMYGIGGRLPHGSKIVETGRPGVNRILNVRFSGT